FLALRLLAAAIISLLYLLLAPGMVLAPALGEGGRAVFRKWATQLLGAVVSKLLFSFLLGVVLAVLAILSDLQALGWWTQWLLMSAFWWGAYVRRHQALGIAAGALTDRRSAGEHGSRSRSIARRMSDVLESRKGMAVARWGKGKLSRSAPSVDGSRRLADAGRGRAKAGTDEQVRRTLEREHDDARARMQDAPERQQGLSEERSRLERMQRERERALAGGDTRRAAELGHRAGRLKGEIERGQEELNVARRVAADGEQALGRTGSPYTREQMEERDRFLDAQAALPAAAWASARSGQRRDYAALAGLAGYGREEYEHLDPGARRSARLQVDRELALRKELSETARSVEAGAAASKLGRHDRRKANREFDSTLRQRMRDGGRSMPASRAERSGFDRWREEGRTAIHDRSSVMSDAHEVAARRKRQLGRDRP
ncbi:MAG TPA: hypothetical protein VES97_11125, partial [Solirubrobacteraceae bacterium]|nr:hypothetical protein [Solirubrobacteraceae bacterium]